jgi:hypothetical protein
MKSKNTKHNGRNWTVDGASLLTSVWTTFSDGRNRLSYDTALTKFEKLKGSKKEKDRREAEDEMERARDR